MFGLGHFGFVGLDKRVQLTVCMKGSPEAKRAQRGHSSGPETNRADP